LTADGNVLMFKKDFISEKERKRKRVMNDWNLLMNRPSLNVDCP